VETLKFWVRPAVIVALWTAAASFTVSELATVVPSLRSAAAQAPRLREARSHTAQARAQPGSGLASAP
jgi:hypothetical protein